MMLFWRPFRNGVVAGGHSPTVVSFHLPRGCADCRLQRLACMHMHTTDEGITYVVGATCAALAGRTLRQRHSASGRGGTPRKYAPIATHASPGFANLPRRRVSAARCVSHSPPRRTNASTRVLCALGSGTAASVCTPICGTSCSAFGHFPTPGVLYVVGRSTGVRALQRAK